MVKCYNNGEGNSMKLFYGSKTLVKKPIFGAGNPSNDYGLGFYLTAEADMAKLWASQYSNSGFSISYDVALDGLNILELIGDDEKTVLSWITLLVKNRLDYSDRVNFAETINWLIKHFDIPINDYDAVIGYRADDSCFNYSRGFLSGDISLETLSQALKLGKLGIQYVLISKEAFKRVSYISHEEVKPSDDYLAFRKKTLNEYHELLSKENRFENTFIGDLMKKYGR